MIRHRTGLGLLIGMVLAACAAPTPAPTAATPLATAAAVSTRLAALLGDAELTLNDGYLLAGGYVLVWPPEFSVSVEGDRVAVSDSETGETAVWLLGDLLWLGGGEIGRGAIDAEAGQRWYGDCEGANDYWLVASINATIAATSTPVPTHRSPATATASRTVPPNPSATASEGVITVGCVWEGDPVVSGELPASSLYPGWKQYTHPKYGFSVDFPSDWQIRLGTHFLCLEPQADPGIVLIIGFRPLAESVTIMRTGVGAGDLITRGTVVAMGQEVTRDVLVYQGQDKAVLYNLAREIKVPSLVITISLDFHDARNYQEPAVGLPTALQATADRIVASLALDQAATISTQNQPLSATSTPLPATSTPLPPTATALPTACAHPWFMANPPPGCPNQPAVYAHTIAQRFERGLLLWRAIPDTYGSQIYAFFDDGQWPAWNPTNDRWHAGDPESDPTIVPPEGFTQPVRGFGLFWREANFVPAGTARDRLGWPVEPEYAVGTRARQCRIEGDWAAGCFLGGPGDQILLIEGNNAWSIWTGAAP